MNSVGNGLKKNALSPLLLNLMLHYVVIGVSKNEVGLDTRGKVPILCQVDDLHLVGART